jgi:hypothetical protein
MINCVQNLRNFNIVKRILEICLKLVDEYFVYIYIYDFKMQKLKNTYNIF